MAYLISQSTCDRNGQGHGPWTMICEANVFAELEFIHHIRMQIIIEWLDLPGPDLEVLVNYSSVLNWN